MDCDRFEATLIDELYEELDELTSAAAKRHVAGCSRCASLIGGLRATRRVAVLSMVEPSVDLEDRILAAARNAQKVVPIGRRLSRAVSWAGSWAMRPQTAMAAVFVLMVGSSLLFVRRSKVMAVDSSLTVTAQGEPAPAAQASAAADEQTSLDSKLAAAAHGTGPGVAPVANAAPAAAAPAPTAAASAYAYGPEGALAYKEGPAERERSLPMYAPKAPAKGFGGGGKDDFDSVSKNAEAPAGAPASHAAPMRSAPRASGGVPADDGVVPSDLDRVQAQASTGVGQAQGGGATRDTSAAALQAAHAVRDSGGGCAAAVSGFDQIAQQAWGTSTGYQAQFDAAECYRTMGQSDQALSRYQKLITVQQFSQLASQGIARVNQSQNQVAAKARKAAPAAKPSAVVMTPQAQTPPQATPPATPPAQQNAPAAADKAQSGF